MRAAYIKFPGLRPDTKKPGPTYYWHPSFVPPSPRPWPWWRRWLVRLVRRDAPRFDRRVWDPIRPPESWVRWWEDTF